MATVIVKLNYASPVTVSFVCNLAITWAVGSKRGTAVSNISKGSTASTPPASAATIPGGKPLQTLAAGDLIAWSATVVAPPSATTPTAYTLTVTIAQGKTIDTMQRPGTVAVEDAAFEDGNWTCA